MLQKVVYIINSFAKGGAENGLLHLVRNGAFDGVELTVVSIVRGTGDQVGSLRELGVRVVTIFPNSLRMSFPQWLSSVGWLRAFLHRERPAVAILSLPQANIAGRIAAMLTRGIVVASFEHNTHLAKRAYEWLFRLTSFRVDCLLADCHATAHEAAKRLYWSRPARMEVLPLISFEHVEGVGRSVDSGDIRILSAGRFTRVKNQAALVEAVAELRSRGTRATAVLFGEGPMRASCQQLADTLGVTEFVSFPGYASDWFRTPSDLFVVTSRHEGLCIVALEAMSVGLPVLAPPVGGLRDYGNDAMVRWLDQVDAKGIADGIEALVAMPKLRAEMAVAGIEVARTKFGTEGVRSIYRKFSAGLQNIRRGRPKSH